MKPSLSKQLRLARLGVRHAQIALHDERVANEDLRRKLQALGTTIAGLEDQLRYTRALIRHAQSVLRWPAPEGDDVRLSLLGFLDELEPPTVAAMQVKKQP